MAEKEKISPSKRRKKKKGIIIIAVAAILIIIRIIAVFGFMGKEDKAEAEDYNQCQRPDDKHQLICNIHPYGIRKQGKEAGKCLMQQNHHQGECQ